MVIINKGESVVEGEVSTLLNSEEMVVSIEVDKPLEAQILISTHFSHVLPSVKIAQDTLTMNIKKAEIASLNQLLTSQGISVFAIQSKRKLEDYFINMINEHALS
jgi:ABC-type multidrug transport system ATPase subunit